MVENKDYSPTPTEWDELILLWNRSKAIFANTISTSSQARLAWTTKTFVGRHSDASHRAVYAWLERNTSRSTSNGHVTTPAGDPDLVAKSVVAPCSSVHR